MFVHSVCLVYACKLQYYEYSKSYTCLFVCECHSLISYRFICIPFRAHDNSLIVRGVSVGVVSGTTNRQQVNKQGAAFDSAGSSSGERIL